MLIKDSLKRACLKILIAAVISLAITWIFSQKNIQIQLLAAMVATALLGHTALENLTKAAKRKRKISTFGKLAFFSFLIMAIPMILLGAIDVFSGNQLMGGISLVTMGMFSLAVASFFLINQPADRPHGHP